MQKVQTHKMYGLITGIIMAVFYLVLYIANLSFKPGWQYVAYIPFLIGIIMNAIAYSKANEHYVTFGNVFGSCFKASAIVAIISLAWAVIMMFIFPEMKEKGIEMARAQMEKNPNVSEEQIDMSLEMTRKYWNVFMVAGSIFITLFYGAIFSLIGSAIAKKKGDRMPMADVE